MKLGLALPDVESLGVLERCGDGHGDEEAILARLLSLKFESIAKFLCGLNAHIYIDLGYKGL